MTQTNLSGISDLLAVSVFESIDIEFAKFLHRISNLEDPVLGLTAALVSYALRNNHICLRMEEYAGKKFPFEQELKPFELPVQIPVPELDTWLIHLKNCKSVVSFQGENLPLIVDEKNRIYLQRYFKYEQNLANFFTRKLIANSTLTRPQFPIDLSNLSQYFENSENPDYQQIAVLASLVNQFTVITGSPGTGKTSVVAAVLAAFFMAEKSGKVAICAPTGKAAARLKDSLQTESENLRISKDIRQKIILVEPSTIHRLLKSKYGSPHFFYRKDNPLKIDLLILDEASMVSQPLMCKLFDALPMDAKVVILGDKDQLASVEEGSVFGDLCAALPINRFTRDFCDLLHGCSATRIQPVLDNPLHNAVVELKKSYRFDDTKGIGLTKTAINAGTTSQIMKILQKENEEIHLCPLPVRNQVKVKILNFIQSVQINLDGHNYSFNDYLQMEDLQQKFKFMENFRILCAKRSGSYGVEYINRVIIEHYFNAKTIYSESLPVMITTNDNRLKLYNGDIGIVQIKNNVTKIYFPHLTEKGRYRSFFPVQIPRHEPVFAMTVHKSQGSGFQKILLILPEKDSPLLTRELLYTGITRAEKQCEIWSFDAIIQSTVDRVTVRDSGLKDKLLALNK
ncbi:MAG: exodeoxyribonuclease V subunit alpha [Candidatus Marinimicrobia bacterium]|nr:exodeoxyribonuclease V subunit alpha [Candidatus Neomarinimicrobiota bacterium]